MPGRSKGVAETAAAGEILLRRLEYLLAGAAELDTGSTWIQLCEVVVIATMFHDAGLVGDDDFRRVLDVEARVVRQAANAKRKGACKATA